MDPILLFRLVLRLCRRPGRDRGPGLAGPARRQPRARAVGGGRRAAHRQPRSETQRPGRGLARRRSTPTAAGRCSKLLTGGLRVGLSARLAKQAAADMAWRLRPHGRGRRDRGGLARRWSRPMPSCSPGWRPRAERPDPTDAGALPPGDAGSGRSTRPSISASSIRPTTPPNGNGTASASRPCARARRARPVQPHGRRHLGRLSRPDGARSISKARSTANCWSCATARVAPFGDLQQRLNRKTRRRQA